MRTRLACFCAAVSLLTVWPVNTIFSAQFNFTPGLIVTEEYTDNIFLASEGEEDDFITSVGASLTGEVLWRTAGINLTYTPAYLLHADHSEEDTWRHAVDLVAFKELTRSTRFDLTNSYLRTIIPNDQSENLQAETDPLSQPLIRGDRNRRGLSPYYTNVSSARLTHNFGPNDTVYAQARYSIFREVDDPAPGLASDDSDIFEPSAGIAYWFNPNWGFQLDLVYSDRQYEARNDRQQYDATARINRRISRHLSGFVGYRHTYLDYSDDTLNSDVTVSLPTIGFTYQLEQNATITMGGGYYFQSFDDDAIEDDNGFIVDAEIFKGFVFRRARIDLIGSSGYTIDDRGVEDLGLNIFYDGRINASYSFTQNFSGTLGGLYRHDEYPNETPTRTEQTINASAGLSYQAMRWMALSLTYSYGKIISNIPTNEYTVNRVLFSVNLAPSTPIRFN